MVKVYGKEQRIINISPGSSSESAQGPAQDEPVHATDDRQGLLLHKKHRVVNIPVD